MQSGQDAGWRLRDMLLIAVVCILFIVALLAIIAGLIWLAGLVLSAATDGQTWAHWVLGGVAGLIVVVLVIGLGTYSGE